MKNRLAQIVSICLGFAMIVAVLYAVYRLLSFLIGALAVLPTTIAAALVTGSITIIGSVVAVALGRYLEKTKEVQAAFRERRLKTYEGFISVFMELTSGKQQTEDLVSFLRQVNKEMILWAGPKLLKAYIAFFKQSVIDAKAGKTFFALEDFYRAIREDLGHSNTGLDRGDILALLIKLDELDLLLQNMKGNPNYHLG